MKNLRITHNPTVNLIPHPQNPRTHTRAQIRQVKRSIKAFGFIGVVVVDANNHIIAGHARVEAAKSLGIEIVPTICVDHLSEAELLAFMVADNKLTENAAWDEGFLSEIFEILDTTEIDFDLGVTGFEAPEIDVFLDHGDEGTDDDPADEIPPVPPVGPPVSCLGDMWMLGNHRLLCADALIPKSYTALLDGEKAQLVFTDPPYNVPIKGHVSGKGKNQHADFSMAVGEMSDAEFIVFLETVMRLLTAHSVNGSVHFICIDWRHVYDLLTAGRAAYSALLNMAVWAKTNAGMGSLYRSQHELIAVFKNGRRKHINNIELGRHGRNRSNLWNYAGANSFGESRDEALAMHPTVKPLSLVSDALLDCSSRGGRVLDPFGGSGTTLLAAEKTGRKARVMELEASYVDVAIRRWQAYSGRKAVLNATGKTFDQTSAERLEGGTDTACATE